MSGRSRPRYTVSYRLAAVVLALSVVTSACSGGGGGGEAEARDTVRIVATEDPWPGVGASATSTHFVFPLNFNVYEPLVELKPDFSIAPALAERWELLEDGRTWRFHLRTGVKFHDGRALTSDDVLWTFDRQRDARTLTSVLNTLGPASVRQIDERTVDFVPVVPNLRLPEQLAHPHGAILPRDTHFDATPANGTGPYRAVEYRPGEHAVFERFDGYWGGPAPVRRLDVRFVRDAAARAEALRTDAADLAFDVTPDAAIELVKDRRLRVVRSDPGRNQVLYINQRGRPPFDLGSDPVVRQAVSLAIDRSAYARELFASEAQPGRWMAPEKILGASAGIVTPPPVDPERARMVLDEAGWKLGDDGIRSRGDRRLALTLVGWAEVSLDAFELIREQLRAVGIDVTVKAVPDQATFRNVYGSSEFDLDLEVPSQNDGNPALLPVSRMYSRYPASERFAPGGVFDDKAEASLAARSTDEARRAAAEMMELLINETHIVVPLAAIPRTYGLSRSFELRDPHASQANQRWTSLVPAGRG